MKTLKLNFLTALFLFAGTFLISCDEDAPPIENEEEAISRVELNFTPVVNGQPDPSGTLEFVYIDGQGAQSPVRLQPNTPYVLNISLLGPGGENISAEVAAEAADHMFFFGFPNNLFLDPAGDGNIDARAADAVNYLDFDANPLPLGLSTAWETAGVTTASGDFRIILKHQPGEKTATSDITVGATDLDITFPIVVAE